MGWPGDNSFGVGLLKGEIGFTPIYEIGDDNIGDYTFKFGYPEISHFYQPIYAILIAHMYGDDLVDVLTGELSAEKIAEHFDLNVDFVKAYLKGVSLAELEAIPTSI